MGAPSHILLPPPQHTRLQKGLWKEYIPSTPNRLRSPTPLPQLALLFSDVGCVSGDEATLLAAVHPDAPVPPAQRCPAHGCTPCSVPAVPIDALDPCNQREPWGHAGTSTPFPLHAARAGRPAQHRRQHWGALPGTACLRLHHPGSQRSARFPFT